MAERKLNAKRTRFINEYMIDLNGTQAAIRSGYSKKTARAIAAKMLSDPIIKSAIAEKRRQLSEKLEITQERVLSEYAKIAFLDPSEFFDKNGNLLPIHDMPKDSVAVLGGFDVVARRTGENSEEFINKLKFIDKKGALDSLAKHLGLFKENNSQIGEAMADAIVNMPPQFNSIDEWIEWKKMYDKSSREDK